MKNFSYAKESLAVLLGIVLFVVYFSFGSVAKATVLTGADSDVGIFWYVFGGPANDTLDANDSDSVGDVSWPAGNQDSRNIYIGHLTSKFTKVVVDVSSATTDTGQDLDMQYWNGSAWTALTLTAQTHPFDTVGVNSFSFSAPSDWVTTSVGGTSAYYIRTPLAVGTINEKGYVNAQVSQISLQLVPPPGITITESGIVGTSLTESGATDNYTIVLNAQPTSNVTIAVTPDSNSTVSTSSIVFTTTNWDTAVNVTVTAVDDSVAEGSHSSTITHSATSDDSNYNGISINSVVASVADNDTAAITRSDSSAQTAVTEGGATGYLTAVLTSSPTSTVTLTLTPSSQITLSTTTIEFSSANWNIPVTSTITAVNDSAVEGTHTGTITYSVASSNWNYSGLVLTDTSVSITDNDTESTPTVTSNSNAPAATPPTPPALPTSQNDENTPIFVPVPQEVILDKDVPISLILGGENHSLTQVGTATDSQITVILRSEPIIVTLTKSEIQEIDFNKDGKQDIRLQYKGFKNSKPQIEITPLIEVGEGSKALSINLGASSTLSRNVTLTLRAYNASWMAISEDPKFQNVSFVAYQKSYPFTLSEGTGEKTVYVRFRGDNGGTVDSSDRILLEKITTCPLTPGKPYKSPQSPAVYLVLDAKSEEVVNTDAPCVKRLFKDSSTYFTYFSSYKSIIGTSEQILSSVPDDLISFIPLGPNAKLDEKGLVKQVSTPHVYIVLSNKLHWVKTEQVFKKMGLVWNSIQDISHVLFLNFSEGAPIETESDIQK